MPLLGNGEYREPVALDDALQESRDQGTPISQPRKQSQHSVTARVAMYKGPAPGTEGVRNSEGPHQTKKEKDQNGLTSDGFIYAPANGTRPIMSNGNTLSDTPATTPATTAPSSPAMWDEPHVIEWSGANGVKFATYTASTRFWSP